MPTAAPQAWEDDGTALLSRIADEVGAHSRERIDAGSVLHAAQAALAARTLVLEAGSPPPPWRKDDLAAVRVGLPLIENVSPEDLVGHAVGAAWRDGQATLGSLRAALAGRDRRLALETLVPAVRVAIERGLLRLAESGSGDAAVEITLDTLLERPRGGAAVDGQLTARELRHWRAFGRTYSERHRTWISLAIARY